MDFFFTQTLSGTFPALFLKSERTEIRWPESGGGDFLGSDLFLELVEDLKYQAIWLKEKSG